MKKYVYAILAVVLLSLLFSSCSGGTLSVSTRIGGVRNLNRSEYDPAEIREMLNSSVFVNHYRLDVSYDGKLLLSEKSDTENYVFYEDAAGTNGFFIGVNGGEFGGYAELHRRTGYEKPQSVTVLTNENCHGFYRLDDDVMLMFTGLGHLHIDEGSVYAVKGMNSDNVTVEKLCDIGSCPNAFAYRKEDECIYISAGKGIYRLTKSGEVDCVKEIDAWCLINPVSAVCYNSKILVSTGLGIYEYDPATSDSAWYGFYD